MNDQLEEDEDLHNKMKYDHMISDEQITADNAKISTLETNISAKSARVAQLTDEIDLWRRTASKSKSSDATVTGEKQLASRANKAQQRTLTTTQSDVLIAPRNTRHIYIYIYFHGLLQSENMSRSMSVRAAKCCFKNIQQLLEEMSSDIVAAEGAELEHKKTIDKLSDKE